MVTAVVMGAMALSFGGATDAFPRQGGCPNENSYNNHANHGKSAHGADKQGARSC